MPAESVSGSRQKLKAFAAVSFGSAPGFFLPFIAGARFDPNAAGNLLLVVSTAVLLNQVLGSTLETVIVAEASRTLHRGGGISPRHIRVLRLRGLGFSLPITLAMFPALLFLYNAQANGHIDFSSLLVTALPALAFPILASQSSVSSGLLIASGQYTTPLAAQALRTGPAALGCALGAPPVLVVSLLTLGELLRLYMLTNLSLRLQTDTCKEADFHTPSIAGLISQSTSMATSTMNPVVDRAFLVGHGGGAIVSYDGADRLFFAMSHALNNGVILPTVRSWSSLVGMNEEGIRKRLRTDLRQLVLSSLIVTFLGFPVLLIIHEVLGRYGNSDLQRSSIWALILLPSLPLTLLNTAGARLLILIRRSHILPMLAFIDLGINGVADWVLVRAVGTVGVPISTVLMRLVAAVIYLGLISGLVVKRLAGGSNERSVSDALTQAATTSSTAGA